MDSKALKQEYDGLAATYVAFTSEIRAFLEALRVQYKETIDIAESEGRPEGVKSWNSCWAKIQRHEGKIAHVAEVQDMAGVKIICHCLSDLERLHAVLGEELRRKGYFDIQREEHALDTGYRAIHYTFKKLIENVRRAGLQFRCAGLFFSNGKSYWRK